MSCYFVNIGHADILWSVVSSHFSHSLHLLSIIIIIIIIIITLSPLYRGFTLIYPKQTMFLGYTVSHKMSRTVSQCHVQCHSVTYSVTYNAVFNIKLFCAFMLFISVHVINTAKQSQLIYNVI
jgi:hypothetical protein